MSKYYRCLDGTNKIETKSGVGVVLPEGFANLSAEVINQCSYLQSLIQTVIYAAHGPAFSASKAILNKLSSPKKRMEFLRSFQYDPADPVVATVFRFAQDLFSEIYDLRNVLAHEIWMSSKDFEQAVLFSDLQEDARRLTISKRIEYDDEATPEQTFDAIIRYIGKIKLIQLSDLMAARDDANLCSWALMTIRQLLNETDPEKAQELRESFRLFRGTSHLFQGYVSVSDAIEVVSATKKTIGK